MKRFLGIAILLVVFMGCEKPEEPVAPASSQAITAGMGDDYSNMLYFNIQSGVFVKQLPHVDYDLQFETSPEGKYIYLNSSNYMFVKNRGAVPFESVVDTSGSMAWRYDYPTGEASRSAIGTWFDAQGNSKNYVYILNRGFDARGINIGFVKFQIIACDNESYTLRFGTLDNALDTVINLAKDDDKNLMQFWFESLAVEDIEPNKNNWNLHFTQYTDYDLTSEGDTLGYLVRGVLMNTSNTAVARLNNVDWNNIDRKMAEGRSYSQDRNAIGYNWKTFSIDSGIYEVLPDIVYIIRDISGNYYKLRFVDYYNDQGEKGYAQFEIIGL
jgi:hypothetical protein